jgi:hypothetical protein
VYFILHLTWDFLLPEERFKLTDKMPVFLAYARLRRSTVEVPIRMLRLPRQPVGLEQGLTHERAWRTAVALLRFDFNYGDLIRWMEGEYTNAHRDWSSVSDTINAVRDILPPEGYPQVDFARAFRACTEGVPLACDHECSFDSVRARNLYDNHPGLVDVIDEVRLRFAKEEAQSFHIAFPRFVWRFIVGLHLAALVWAVRKLKGRLCVDPSSTISGDDDGAANARIPKPGLPGHEDECPPIFYSTALMRHLTWIWRLRLMLPREDILQYVDDIQAAFHRILYHPDAGIIFAAVFCEFLIVPIGTIFGARNSPSFFTLLSELRAHVASYTQYRKDDSLENLTALTRRVRLSPPPTAREQSLLVQAVPDAFHQGIPEAQTGHYYHNSTFVDDNGIAAYRNHIYGAIDNSTRAAYDIFGHPNEDRRAPCLSEEKLLQLASCSMQYLGFLIDTRGMSMAWPVDKRQQLADLLDELFAISSRMITPRQSSSLLGLVRNGAVVAPLAIYLSLRLQHMLNDATRAAWGSMARRSTWVWDKSSRQWIRKWYKTYRTHLDEATIHDLRLLRSRITLDPQDPVWCRPIALLVKREPTSQCYSDACGHAGLGGWTDSDILHRFMWRLHHDDLIACGFALEWLEEEASDVDSEDPDGLHINVLELIAIIINIWLALVFITQVGDIPGGHILTMLADNTSALSWMRYASRTKRPVVRALSRFILDLTLSCSVSHKLSGLHLQGTLNIGADKLSRFEPPPKGGGKTWASVIAQHSPLMTCQAYRLPRELLSVIATIISSAKTGAPYEPPTTRLLTLVPSTLFIGSEGNASTTSLSARRRPNKRSR